LEKKKKKTFIEKHLNYWNGKGTMILGIIWEDKKKRERERERRKWVKGGGGIVYLVWNMAFSTRALHSYS